MESRAITLQDIINNYTEVETGLEVHVYSVICTVMVAWLYQGTHDLVRGRQHQGEELRARALHTEVNIDK